jgi:CDP-paratose 2-epimerase
VLLYDNLSRGGVDQNYAWLKETHRDRVKLEEADTRDFRRLSSAVARASAVFHFAAQVAVTSSIADPRHDFEVNTLGTLNLLEALRQSDNPPPLIFTSTNKVYGSLGNIPLRLSGDRYEPLDPRVRGHGIPETQPLEFYSPYGCSKGAADQYVIDYSRTYGLPAVVFRMSCIYGPHQFGTEDQGWIAHFLIRAREGRPVTLYGDGRQVRDVLFIEDLLDAFLLSRERASELAGNAFNIGGGPDHAISLRDLLRLIAQIHGEAPPVSRGDWRVGDQRYYVSDSRKFQAATGWSPKVTVREGVRRLDAWLEKSSAASAGANLTLSTR